MSGTVQAKKKHWQAFKIAADETHHTVYGKSAYNQRFLQVLKFHHPGLAPAQDEIGAFHIDSTGCPIYKDRYVRTFGFYDERAAVHSESGWFHIFSDGKEVYSDRFAWCGNFQEKYCAVRDFQGQFFHIDRLGNRAYKEVFSYVGDFHDGIAVVQNDSGQHTHIDFKGYFIHNRWFLDLDVYHKGFARAKDKNGWFHINQKGQAIYKERYQSLEPFYNGIARVETDNGEILLINEVGAPVKCLRRSSEDPFHRASGELVSYWRWNTLQTAIELNVFDHLPNSIENLQKHISLSFSSIRRLMRALEEMGFVEKSKGNQWDMSASGAFFKTNHLYSLKEAAKLWKEEHRESWQHLSYSLKTEKPAFNKLYGKGWFDWLEKNPVKDQLYHKALSVYAEKDYREVAYHIDLSKHKSILDVGGGKGVLLSYLLQENPHLRGLLFDLPNVLKQVVVSEDLESRMECIQGDFFNKWPSLHVESAILSRVLHDWSDELVVHLLKNLGLALTDNASNRIYIIENVLSESDGHGGLLDLNMLVMTGGAERTRDQFQQLLAQGGFVLETMMPLNQVSSILVAKKL